MIGYIQLILERLLMKQKRLKSGPRDRTVKRKAAIPVRQWWFVKKKDQHGEGEAAARRDGDEAS